MKFNLHDYQKYAIQFLTQNKAAALLLDMGLGKTVITLTALWELTFDYFDIEKVLIIALKRVAKSTWRSEIEKWEHLSGLTYSIVLGTKQQRENALNQKSAAVHNQS